VANRVVVLGCSWGGLGVIHDLAATGAEIVAVRTDPGDFAHLSRFVSERATLRIAPATERTSIDPLLDRAEWHGSCLFATTDSTVELVARHRDALAARYSITTIPWGRLRTLLDKGRLYRFARDLGLESWLPRFHYPIAETESWREWTVFPCLIKPVETYKCVARFGVRLFVVHRSDQLRARLAETKAAGIGVIVSEIIPGGDDRLFQYRVYVDRNGDAMAEVCTQKLRQHPPGYGCGRLTRTVPMIEALREPTLALLRGVDYRGYAYGEFKLDPRDGRYKLIEVNVRPGMSQRLLRAAGVNVSQLAVIDCAAGVAPAAPSYRAGVYWIDLFTDPIGYLRWRRIERPRFRDYFAPYFAETVASVPWTDPLPFLERCWTLFRQGLAALGRRLTRRSAAGGRPGDEAPARSAVLVAPE
jgi:predicted ATP-grasp superfamily ATP-dependent carboligase